MKPSPKDNDMFWRRKPKVTDGALGLLLQPPIPPKKEFETMLELLRDAEKYDIAEESDSSKAVLRELQARIDAFCS